VHHTVNRNLRHVSVIAYVSAAGGSLIPYIVTSQTSSHVREQLKTRTATSLLECFLGIPLPQSKYPNNDRCTDIGISSATDRLSDRDRVKKLIFGYCRISPKTMMEDSTFGIEKSVDQNGSKSETLGIQSEDIETRNRNRSRLVPISASDRFQLCHTSDN
jgi:hypothetical protein